MKPQHPPSESQRRRAWVTRAARVGLPDHQMAFQLGMTREELHFLYSDDIRNASITLNLEILETLADFAKSGKHAFATIFWVKNRIWNGKQEDDHSSEEEKDSPFSNAFADFIVTGPNGERE